MSDQYAIGLVDEKPRLRTVTMTIHDDIAKERRELDMAYFRIALRRRFQATQWGQAGLTLLAPEEGYKPPNRPMVLLPLAQHIAARCRTLRDMITNAIQVQVAIENAREQ
jgi:hypothetical protein